MTNIVITGASGRMGQALVSELSANKNDLTLVAAVARRGSALIGRDVGLSIGATETGVTYTESIGEVDFDVLIDFTLPEPSLANLQACVERGKAIVIGTTGFTPAETDHIRSAGERIPIVWAPNMSVGVNLTLHLLRQAAQVIGDQADVEIIETHHRNKLDAPSGTALHMGEVIAAASQRSLENCAEFGRSGSTQIRDQSTIGFSSIRAGDVVGDHTVLFALDGERIEITHKASDRRIYASGALRAAVWLRQQTAGYYDMRDVLALRL